MESFFQVSEISSVIQLAVAPVFLLAGISGALSVMSTRLGRIVDRGRTLKVERDTADEDELLDIRDELKTLGRRARFTNWAISLCTTCALFICLVIVVLFIGALFDLNVAVFIAFLFVVAMLCLITAFILFLKEVELSTSAFRFKSD